MRIRFSVPVLVFLFSMLTLGVEVFGQGMSSTPAPPSTITRPESIQDSGTYGYWTHMSGQGRAGGVLLGKLAVEGEPLLWEPVLVSVDCGGSIVYTTRTDPNGNFAIAPAPASLNQQGDAKRQMETQYEGCRVQAALAGFHSNALTITQHNLQDDPNLGTLTLSRQEGRAEGTAFSATTASAPPNARKFFDRARTELLEQRPDKAERDLEKAVQIYPGFAGAWFEMGKLQLASSAQEARSSFAKAAAADPKFVSPYEQLAVLDAQDQKWQDAANESSHALELNPAGTSQLWFSDALANFHLGHTDLAEASALKSLAMDPVHTIPNDEQLLAVILALKGDYAGALKHLRNCLTYLPSGSSADLVKQQIAQLEQRVGANKDK
jgi:tetratricopeptide (TPR) repeat protein